ncbi:MAG: dienelactone hydrolase family protein [Candidatus Lustribacter sp.]
MRVMRARPADDLPRPALVFYSDIFALTESTQRMVVRFAGYGFAVFAPEIYWRFEPPGTAYVFDDAGRDRGQACANRMRVRDFDDDIGVLLAHVAAAGGVRAEAIGAVGWCLGGHVAFRAAFSPRVKATACFYPTGLHDGELAGDGDAGSLARASEITGPLLTIFGSIDPHTDAAGRAVVERGLQAAGIRRRTSLYEAEHAFMRDVGPRYDPAATDAAFAEALEWFRAAGLEP